MPRAASFLRSEARRLAAVLVVVPLFFVARLPRTSEPERAELAARFRFEAEPLDAFAELRTALDRDVHPSLAHLRGWISTVGASVAFADLDGDGLANDLCWVDTQSNLVIAAPAPGTGERYAPFVLDPAPLPFERATMAPMGCRGGDLNEDGLADLIVYYWGRSPIAFLRRDLTAPTSPRAEGFARREVVDPVEPWYTNALTQADVDGDGHADLVVGNYFPDGAQVLDVRGTGVHRMHDSMSRAFDGGRNRVLLWGAASGGPEPTILYREAELGLSVEETDGWTLALGAADLDGDLLPEIYIVNDFGPDRLFSNRSQPGSPLLVAVQGRRELTTPRSKVLGGDSFKGMGIDFGDLNGDGILDFYVSNIAVEYGLEEAHLAFLSTGETALMKAGRAPYAERGEVLGIARGGWAWDVRFGDFDNDGALEIVQGTGFLRGTVNRWPELHEAAMGNDQLLGDPRAWHRFAEGDDLSGHQPNRFYVRGAGERYVDLASEVGLGADHVTRGIATADVDGDGDLDLAYANQWEPPVFQRNVSPSPGKFLGLHLRLPAGSRKEALESWLGHPRRSERTRPAIGAQARVVLADGGVLVSQVDGGNGHSGGRSHDLHFGLGARAGPAALRVELRWRSARGESRSAELELVPGWHTVVLGDEQRIEGE